MNRLLNTQKLSIYTNSKNKLKIAKMLSKNTKDIMALKIEMSLLMYHLSVSFLNIINYILTS